MLRIRYILAAIKARRLQNQGIAVKLPLHLLKGSKMAYRLFLLSAALVLLLAIPTWAEASANADVLEFTVTAYKDGQAYAGGAPHLTKDGSIESFGVGNQAGSFEFWVLCIYDLDAARPDWVAKDLARFDGKLQHVYFHGAEFLFYSSAVDWIEIEVRGCQQTDLDRYLAVMGVSMNLDEDILNKVVKPLGHIGFAATKFPPVP
jgi:hypothetical protein